MNQPAQPGSGKERKKACSRARFITKVVAGVWRFGKPAGSDHSPERAQEALVLLVRAVGDPDVAGAAERLAGSDDDAGIGEAGDDLALVALAEVDPGEVRLGLGRLEAELPDSLFDRDALDDRRLDPPGDVVAVADRLGACGL